MSTRELRVISLPIDPVHGVDDAPLQRWLGAGRRLVRQESHLVERGGTPWLILVLESERHEAGDPWARATPHPPAEAAAAREHAQDSARARQRREGRARRKRDLEAALARLDEPGRLLYASLRSWRTARAEAAGLPPYEFGSDLLLCEVARVRPTTTQGLRALPQCKPRFFKLAGEELLTLLRDLESSEEQSWQGGRDQGEGAE